MTKSINYLSLFLIFILLLASCSKDELRGSDPIISKTVNVNPFSKIQIFDDMEVYITKGSEQNIEIRANENLIDRLLTEVNETTLTLQLEPGSYEKATFEVRIQVPTLELLEMNDNTRADLTIRSNALSLIMRNAAQLELSGNAAMLNTLLEGSSQIQGFNFTTELLETVSRDASSMEINCTTAINGILTNASSVLYRGTPALNAEIREAGQLLNAN